MAEKIVSQLNEYGYLVGATIADESPAEPGVYLLPLGAIDLLPPAVIEPSKRYKPKADGSGWIAEPAKDDSPEYTPEEIAIVVTAERGKAYRNEADPLFFKWQRGEATKEEWLAKVAEIKARFPDGVMPQ